MRWQDYLWLLLFSGGAFMFYRVKNKRRRRPARKKKAGGPLTRREQKAWHKLQAAGYRLEEIHPSMPVSMDVDDKRKDFFYDGSFIVSRGGETFLVKMSKGESPLSRAALRRELLLDSLFFQTDGLFYYQEEREELKEIRFAYESEEESGAGSGRLLRLAVLLLLIVIGALVLVKIFKSFNI